MWLLTAIQEVIGDHYLRQKSGSWMYEYIVSKRMKKLYKLCKVGAERFSLNSQYVPHFSETQGSGDVYYLKCQLIMHTFDQLVSETIFYTVLKELFIKSKSMGGPTFNLMLFRKLLKDKGMKNEQF